MLLSALIARELGGEVVGGEETDNVDSGKMRRRLATSFIVVTGLYIIVFCEASTITTTSNDKSTQCVNKSSNDDKKRFLSSSLKNAIAVDSRGGGDEIDSNRRRVRTITALHQTSFLTACSLSMVLFAPLPTLTKYLTPLTTSSSSTSSLLVQPQARAIRILSSLSAVTAAVELLLSPLVGSIIDTHGRRVPTATLHGLVSLANLITSTMPGVNTVCLSRVANVLGGGFNIIITNAVIADLFGGGSAGSSSSNTTGGGARTQGMGAALGTQAAYASLGFLLGSLIGGRLTKVGERLAYGACSILSALAMCNVVFRMTESLDYGDRYTSSRLARSNDDNIQQQHRKEQGLVDTKLPTSSSSSMSILMTKFIEAPLSSIRLLYHYGPKMRTLATLLVLQSIPMFMGDVFQLFAKEEWGLRPREFANLVAAFGILGIVSNISVPFMIRSLGLRSFSLFATVSSLLFPITTLLVESYKIVVAAGCIGLFGSAQKLGTNAAMTTLASELGVPQGRLQGEKASMLALLKIGSPIVYGMLYLRGKTWSSAYAASGGKNDGVVDKVLSNVVMGKIGMKLPFVLNVILGLCALVISWQNL